MKYCPNCGAALDASGRCRYCNTVSQNPSDFPDGSEYESAYSYREIECREAGLGFFPTVFPLIFALAFGILGVAMPLTLFRAEDEKGALPILLLIFGSITVVSFAIFAWSIIKFLLVKIAGKETYGTVIGYRSDPSFLINGFPATTCEILINLNFERVVLLYQTGKVSQPFPINSTVRVRCYKDLFQISLKDNGYEVWNNIR